jgi:hypothetical protein
VNCFVLDYDNGAHVHCCFTTAPTDPGILRQPLMLPNTPSSDKGPIASIPKCSNQSPTLSTVPHRQMRFCPQRAVGQAEVLSHLSARSPEPKIGSPSGSYLVSPNHLPEYRAWLDRSFRISSSINGVPRRVGFRIYDHMS